MDRKRLFNTFAFLVIFVFLLNFVAIKLYWYYSIWYFDMPMHFLGGLSVGLILIWLLSFKIKSLEPSLKLAFYIILGVLIVGVSWEIFEFIVYNFLGQNAFNILDTTSDVFFDLAGGSLAVLYFFRRFTKSVMLQRENTVQ